MTAIDQSTPTDLNRELHIFPMSGRTSNPNWRGILNAYRRRDARRTQNRSKPAPLAHYPFPWPVNYDPPSCPFKPGKWPEKLRQVWELWREVWDDIAEDMLFESVGELWSCFDLMTREGMKFDPRFVRDFNHLRESLTREHLQERDDLEEDGTDGCLDG